MRLIDADRLLETLSQGAYSSIRKVISREPTVDAEPVVHGHWVTEKAISIFPICSNCNTVNACHSPYCGACGAKMDEGQECEI